MSLYPQLRVLNLYNSNKNFTLKKAVFISNIDYYTSITKDFIIIIKLIAASIIMMNYYY